ncbi:hypothetical protein GCM10027060_17240 [Nesterenkonia halophila]|uniref:BNR-4 repeat-containing protein n=1 Tax=Nesterenkonia halophila TaxID=302044 RepID=UPI0014794C3E|nr:BNR-4 repeat-containing protein [Nesterenkonia halophila]
MRPSRPSAMPWLLSVLVTPALVLPQTGATAPPSPAEEAREEPLVCTPSSDATSYDTDSSQRWRVADRSVVDPSIWSGHQVSQDMVVDGPATYVGYYDADRHLTVGYRPAPGHPWETRRLSGAAAVVGWDSHNGIDLAVDSAGDLHVAANMHLDDLRYWRTSSPGDLDSLERVETMVSPDREDQVTYPAFRRADDGTLIFDHRNGGAGDGTQFFSVYDPDRRSWSSLVDGPLFDGGSSRDGEDYSAYHRITEEPNSDGYYEMTWVWRRTPDAATNSRLSYARSTDLEHWETASGKPLDLPLRRDAAGVVVDDVPEHGGLLNGAERVAEDSSGRPVVVYPRLDDAGDHQLFGARPSADGWETQRLTRWTGSMDLEGEGTLSTPLHLSDVESQSDGSIRADFRCSGPEKRARSLILDGRSLKPVAETAIPSNGYPAEITRRRETTPPADHGVLEVVEPADDERRAMFWQSRGSNGDRPFQQTPSPLPLRVYTLEPQTAASPPRQLQAEPSSQGLRLTWRAPTDDGGSPITGYRIETSRDGGMTWRRADHVDSTAARIDPERADGPEDLTMRVTATNRNGAGDGATVVASVPGTMAAVEASGAADVDGARNTWVPTAAGGGILLLLALAVRRRRPARSRRRRYRPRSR